MLSGKSIAVTGAAQGIGRAVATVCAEAGAKVLLCDINGPLVQEAAKALAGRSARALALEMDDSRRSDIQRMVSTAVENFGALDGVVCGGMRRAYGPAESFSDEDWDLVVTQGLTGYFRCAQESARQMFRQERGSIVFITSIAGSKAVDGGAAYCAVKAGIAGLTRQLGVEWARRGIRTNSVAPGFTVTEGALRKMSEAEAQALIPIGKPASAVEVANVCAFLLSDLASHITGQEIVVDGGFTVGASWTAGAIRR